MVFFHIEVNIEEMEISFLADKSLIGKAGKILPEVLEKFSE
jgi:hypothetical protein